MKFFKKKNNQKMFIAILMVIVLNFSIPNYSQAGVFGDIAGDLLKELVQLVASIGDVAMGALNHFMLGTDKVITSSMLELNDANITNENSWLHYDESKVGTKKTVEYDQLDGLIFSSGPKIPNFLYCPENIFSNRIAMLDVNFVRSHDYTGVEYNASSSSDSEKKAESAAGDKYGIRDTIASWYKAFRNIAIVGLLTVLVYLGIRIIISSTAADKAKYKESLQDWLVALCLVFIIHFIMSGIMMFTDKFTDMIDGTINKPIGVTVSGAKDRDGNTLKFNTNLIGYVRFMSQNEDWGECTAYTIMYLALVLYTVMFTFTYFKRFLYMAFFTMIAPLVALTYPIDKVKDGKAQAFDMWFKEYTMNAIIQPIHLILYSVFIGSAIDLATSNPIYAIVAMAFLTSAEKFVKAMFGLDKAKTPAGLATMAGGALAMKGMGNLVGKLSGKNSKGNNNGGAGSDESIEATRSPNIRMDAMKTLVSGTLGGGTSLPGGTAGGAAGGTGTAGGSAGGATGGTGPTGSASGGTTGGTGSAGGSAGGTTGGTGSAGGSAGGATGGTGSAGGSAGGATGGTGSAGGAAGGATGGTGSAGGAAGGATGGTGSAGGAAGGATGGTGSAGGAAGGATGGTGSAGGSAGGVIGGTGSAGGSAGGATGGTGSAVGSAGGTTGGTGSAGGTAGGATGGTGTAGGAAGGATGRTGSAGGAAGGATGGTSGPILSPGTDTRSKGQAIKAGLGNVVSSKARRFKNAMEPDNVKKKVLKGGKAVAHGAVRAGAAAAMAATVGTATAAAAIVSGEKAGSILATGGTMMMAGAQGLGKKAVGKMDKVNNQIMDDYNAGRYTKDELKKIKRDKYDREWKRKEENYKYLMQKRNMSSKEAKEYLQDSQTQKYLDQGITDIGVICNARDMASKRGWSDDQALSRAKLAQQRGKNLKDDTAQNALIDRIMNENRAITRDMARNLVAEITQIADV